MADNYFVPDYVLSFKCSMCSECCKQWKIAIDRETYARYEALAKKDPSFLPELKANFNKNKDGTGDIIIKKTEIIDSDKKILIWACPFLNEEGLCSIQKRYGEACLSDTCKSYPREIAVTPRGLEMSLSFSCRSAAELLKKKEPVEFYQNPMGFDFLRLNEQYLPMHKDEILRMNNKTIYFEIEEMLIDIAQFREIDIDIRLIITGIIVDKIVNVDMDGIKAYLSNLNESVIQQLRSINANTNYMLSFIKQVVEKRIRNQGIYEQMINLLDIVYNDLKLLNGEQISKMQEEMFVAGYEKYYRKYANKISHVLENYLVNFIFSKKFYYMKYFDAYFMLVMHYVLIRFFAVCKCMQLDKPVDEDILVHVINSIERSIAHNNNYKDEILQLAKQGECYSLPYVLLLINVK